MQTLLKEREVCQWLKISRTTFWRLKKEGLPTIKIGNSYRYDMNEIANWIERSSKNIEAYRIEEEQRRQEYEIEADDKIINSYRISFEYLREHNARYLQSIFSPEQNDKLRSRLEKFNDENLSNQEIVRIFIREYLNILKDDYQRKTRPSRFNSRLNDFVNRKNGAIKIVWGDCLDALRQMESESVQLMVTSPPYYNAREYAQWSDIDKYLDDMRAIIRESYRVLDNHRVWVWNVGDIFDNDNRITRSVWGKRRLPLGAYFIKIFEEEGFEFVDDVIWDKGEVESKRHMNGGMDFPFYQYPLNCYEHILIFHKHRLDTTKIPCPVCGSLKVNGNTQSEIGVQSWECKNEKCFVRSVNNRGKRFSLRTIMMQDWFSKEDQIDKTTLTKWRRDIVSFPPVIKINQNGKNILGHSAPFPKDIPEMAIKYFSYVGENVLDPFAGSFTAPIVAKSLNRNGIGIELNKSMHRDSVVKRLASGDPSLFAAQNSQALFEEFDLNPI
ncbi:MAG: DNA methyltransferase [Chloroherpetonaceae bacterium]|nr:DNA methyltransferase [Chloroherpetonaceae bacterium]